MPRLRLLLQAKGRQRDALRHLHTIPECSSFGETEESCKEKKIPYVSGRALYENNARGKITGDLDGITKLIVARDTRKIIGVHVIGERASELVHIGQTAIQLRRHRRPLIDMVFNYPNALRLLQIRGVRMPRRTGGSSLTPPPEASAAPTAPWRAPGKRPAPPAMPGAPRRCPARPGDARHSLDPALSRLVRAATKSAESRRPAAPSAPRYRAHT